MNGYHYIMASLPSLSADSQPPFAVAQLLERIRGFVPDKDHALLAGIANGEAVDCRPAREYIRKKERVDMLLLSRREKRLFGRNAKYFDPPDADPWTIGIVEKAFDDPDPLNAEMSMLRLYWDCAESIGFMHCFDFTAMCAYVIKLMILSRKASFDEARGAEEFARLSSSLRVELGCCG